jgi:hypothetical protein
MTHVLTYDRDSFKGMEQEGWQRHAAGYDELFGSVTPHAMKPSAGREWCWCWIRAPRSVLWAGIWLRCCLDSWRSSDRYRLYPRQWSTWREIFTRRQYFSRLTPNHCPLAQTPSMQSYVPLGSITFKTPTRQSLKPFESSVPEESMRSLCGAFPANPSFINWRLIAYGRTVRWTWHCHLLRQSFALVSQRHAQPPC